MREGLAVGALFVVIMLLRGDGAAVEDEEEGAYADLGEAEYVNFAEGFDG